jgi:heme/copper-type cytochrome/quinol oxidase subunit 3
MSLVTFEVEQEVRHTNGRVPPPPPPGDDGDRGDRDPGRRRGLDNLRLAILILIAGEIMFFGGLVTAFLVLRVAAPVWPPPFQPRLPILVTGLNTLVLLGSSVALAAAARAWRAGDQRELVRRLSITAVLGGVFLAVQGYEWVRLIGFGLTMSSGVFGTTFYGLIGTHALHVVAALLWLGVITALAARGRFGQGRTAPLGACAMYWHFVVALWPVLYVTVYW